MHLQWGNRFFAALEALYLLLAGHWLTDWLTDTLEFQMRWLWPWPLQPHWPPWPSPKKSVQICDFLHSFFNRPTTSYQICSDHTCPQISFKPAAAFQIQASQYMSLSSWSVTNKPLHWTKQRCMDIWWWGKVQKVSKYGLLFLLLLLQYLKRFLFNVATSLSNETT